MSKTINDFITITSNGLEVMDYADIIDTLMDEYRAIYGAEIELDPRSGDGRFIYDYATIINNGVQSIQQMYANWTPSLASGYYLDALCSLTNVYREPASASQIKAKITNSTSADVQVTDLTNIYCVADNGDIWAPEDDIQLPLTIQVNSSVYIIYTSPRLGQIGTSTFKFATSNTQNASLNVSIYTFTEGKNIESDASLRYRRASDSSYGLTVLEGVQGKLKKVFGVDDCYIQSYAGNTDESEICYVNNQATTMPLHSVSILLRYNSVNQPKKDNVYTAILNNLTSGVSTNGTTHHYQLTKTKVITAENWYITEAQHPAITITLSNLYNFAGITTAQAIAKSLLSYLNHLFISQAYTTSDLLSVIQKADPLYMSRSTFVATAIDGLFDENGYQMNRGCYFDYGSRLNTDYKVTLSSDNTTITIEVI